MRNVWYGLFGSAILFVFLYAWYIPSNNSRQLVLDLPANGISKSIPVRSEIKIDQTVILLHDANSVVLPLHAESYTGSGVIHLQILKNQKVVIAQGKMISDTHNNELVFEFPQKPLRANILYTLEFSFSGIEQDSNLAMLTAFGKYADLSETVTQYIVKDNPVKITDARHGNIALSLYNNPPKNHALAALKIFALPALVLIVIGLWAAKVVSGMNRIHANNVRPDWREYISVTGIGIMLAAIATTPLFIHSSYISNHGDINRGLVYNVIAKRDILMGHLPQWNQYICGGSPLIGDLESWFLHPIFFLTLPFSEVLAMKITYSLVLLSSFIGFYALARIILLFRIPGSALFAIMLAFGGYLSAHLAEGYYVWTASAYIPWFLLFAMLSLKNIAFVPLAGFMLACMFGAGSMHLVVYSMLFIALVWLFSAHHRKFSERVAVYSCIAIFFVVMSSVKLLPAFSVLTATSSREGFAPFVHMLPAMLFGRGLLGPVMGAGQTIRWGEFDGYIGIASFVVALIGGIIFRTTLWKHYKPFLIGSAVMGVISFMPLPITQGFISHIFDLFRMPSRVLLFGIFGIALVAGYAVDAITYKQRVWVWVLIGLIACDLISNDMILFSRTFTVPMPELHTETNFQRVSHAYTSGDETYYRTVYLDFLENRGTNDVCRFYQTGPFTRAIDETDPRHVSRGEVYLEDVHAGTISYTVNTRSKYSIHADITSPANILINQNYYPGWVTNSGQIVENKGGIVSIPVQIGTQDIELTYRPSAVYWGIVLSLFACLTGSLLWLKRNS